MSTAGTVEWTVFALLVAGLLAIDIGYAGRGAQAIRSLERGENWKWCYVDGALIENR